MSAKKQTKKAVKKKTTHGNASQSIDKALVHELKESIVNHVQRTLGRDLKNANVNDWWTATSLTVRDRIMDRYIETLDTHKTKNVKRVYYLSLEYLMGQLLNNSLYSSNLHSAMEKALVDLGVKLEDLVDNENDMGLGNGGLGRLAACFLDSMATLDLPAIGYGIHYQFGLFKQEFVNGYQIEHPDDWMNKGCPWEIRRPDFSQEVKLYGYLRKDFDDKGNYTPVWCDYKTIQGVPYDIPIPGYNTTTVNFLRLWNSQASDDFDLKIFNDGGYVEAVREKAEGETISKVLYPNDSTESGKELRLVQQYFFVTCSLKDIIRRFFQNNDDWGQFPEKVSIQLNDTHPAVAVIELMRIMLDEYKLDWEYSWNIVRKTMSYTNHTLLPEALEKWSVALFERVLPRHLEIVYEINRIYLETEVAAKWPGDDSKISELSIIEEGDEKMIRMAYLSVVGSHSVNGVAALHTELLKKHLFNSFHQLYPNKLQNKTNGITPRRWLLACNPELSTLISTKIKTDWSKNLDDLKSLDKLADNSSFQKEFMAIKRNNKVKLAEFVKETMDIEIDPEALFDSQIKRLHEYKRQHLNLLHILTIYRRLLHNPDLDISPRVFIFGAKAAPGYDLAKSIIRAINKVGETINKDERIQGKLKVVFIPNYNISVAERIIPATDLSEQISTAGKEASGTGNMKFALNGALTIGTLDGANVEIDEEVGRDNIFIFGHTVEEVEALKSGDYNPYEYMEKNEELKAIIGWLSSDYFTPGEHNAFQDVVHSILDWGDPFMVMADYEMYIEAQEKVSEAYKNKKNWAKMAIINTARVGKFSSDRTIREYADEIWKLESVPVN
tara:strand:+ start:1039 stop:3552 length:2514 start_codon:yes stop_codon:yes gene_type:complete